MSRYSSRPRSLFYLAVQAARYYFVTLKVVFPSIFLFVLIENSYDFFSFFSAIKTQPLVSSLNYWFRLIDIFLCLLLEIYFLSVALYAAHTVLMGSPVRLKQAFQNIFFKLPTIYLSFLVLVFLSSFFIFIVYFLMKSVALFVFKINGVPLSAILFFVGFPFMLFLMFILPVMPMQILHEEAIWRTIRKSVLFVWHGNIFRVFFLYAAYITVCMTVVLSVTRHGFGLIQHHSGFIVELITLSVLGLLLINFTLFFLNDLNIRNREKYFSS